ncbi:MAG: XdhC family protein [Acidimicrobiia bacterium]|nr:XdhC family protein [Acidimicrobiia bacterium]
MTELDGILETMIDWESRGVPFALATVVGVRGSTYRGLAARQAVSEHSASVGTISGGCLDNDLHQVAATVIATGKPMLVEFDLTADDEAIWGWGIGCNGATEVLVEPSTSALELAERLRTSRLGRRSAIVHSLDPDDLGSRRFITPSGGTPVLGKLTEAAQEAMREGRHRVVEVEGERSLIEVVGSPSRLLVCGAGHDADPVVKYGAELGFETIVTDDRRHLLTTERFPDGTELIHAEARELSSVITVDERTYVVLMSHNYLRDLEYLRQLHGSPAPYIGALGPSDRLDRLYADLASEGVVFDDDTKRRIRGPAGLDIGAEGPLEIAWSIMSEILAVRTGASGAPVSVVKRRGRD